MNEELPSITEEEIATLEELDKKATKGEFRCVDDTGIWAIRSFDSRDISIPIVIDGSKEDCELMSYVRNLLPRLLKEWREFEGICKKWRDVCDAHLKEKHELEYQLKKMTAQKDVVIEKMKNALSFFVDQNPTWPPDMPGESGFFNWLSEGRKIARQCLEEIKDEL